MLLQEAMLKVASLAVASLVACHGRADPVALVEVATAVGAITWQVDFDADAEAAGYADCSYSRDYTNGVEFRHSPWLCTDCEAMVAADTLMTAGQDDCYSLVSSDSPVAEETLGWGAERFWRGAGGANLLTDQGSASIDGSSLATFYEVPIRFDDASGDTWDAQFTVIGELILGTTMSDPMAGLYPPASYACGWPQADPPAYTGDYSLTVGQTLPDGIFRDACDDAVRLHDLAGSWLVIDVAAMDCGPCQSMAAGATAFEASMADQGISARSVTLLAPSLSDPLGATSATALAAWASEFALEGPILADRGYGVWVVGRGAEATTGEAFGYPTWVVVDPALVVVSVHVGFGSWDDAEAVVLANQ
jgi:hypothetical protein